MKTMTFIRLKLNPNDGPHTDFQAPPQDESEHRSAQAFIPVMDVPGVCTLICGNETPAGYHLHRIQQSPAVHCDCV